MATWFGKCLIFILCLSKTAGQITEAVTTPEPEIESVGDSDLQKPMSGDYYNTFHNLHLQILQSYNPHVRPEIGAGRPMSCNFSMVITHLNNADENAQTIDMNGWIILQWYDRRLAWNDSSEFMDIRKLVMEQKMIWKPEIHLYNNAQSTSTAVTGSNILAQIYSDGKIVVDPSFSLKPYCQFDYKHFPWDSHACSVYIGSWTYRTHEFKWHLNPITPASVPIVIANSQRSTITNWKITNATAQLADLDFENELWHYVNISITLERTPTFAANFVLIPILITAFLTGVAFLFAAGRNDWKIVLLLLALILEVVHFISVYFVLPQGVINGKALVVTFCKANIGLTVTAILIGLITKCVSHRRGRLPRWLSRILQSKMLRSACCYHEEEPRSDGVRFSLKNVQNRRQGQQKGFLVTNQLIPPKRTKPSYTVDEQEKPSTSSKLEESLQSRANEDDTNETSKYGLWNRLAILLDRLFSVVLAIVFAFFWVCFVGF